MRWRDVVVICFDPAAPNGLEALKPWVTECERFCHEDATIIIMALHRNGARPVTSHESILECFENTLGWFPYCEVNLDKSRDIVESRDALVKHVVICRTNVGAATDDVEVMEFWRSEYAGNEAKFANANRIYEKLAPPLPSSSRFSARSTRSPSINILQFLSNQISPSTRVPRTSKAPAASNSNSTSDRDTSAPNSPASDTTSQGKSHHDSPSGTSSSPSQKTPQTSSATASQAPREESSSPTKISTIASDDQHIQLHDSDTTKAKSGPGALEIPPLALPLESLSANSSDSSGASSAVVSPTHSSTTSNSGDGLPDTRQRSARVRSQYLSPPPALFLVEEANTAK